ncbi:MAG: SRPBCC family protein [Woeseiaceae bacterium]
MKNLVRRISAFAVLFATATALAQSGDRSVITTRHMPATPDQVMQAFLNSDDLYAWWATTRSLVEPKTGGIWAIAWDDWGEAKTHHSWTGVVSQLSADRLVISPMLMTEPDMPLLGPMSLAVLVEVAEGGGTNVTVTHSGYGYGDHWDEMYNLVVNGWDHVLGDMATWFAEGY